MQVHTDQSLQVLNGRTTFLTLNGKEIRTNVERVVYVLPIQVEAILGWKVTCPKGKTKIKPSSKRLMTYKRNHIVGNGSGPLLVQIRPLMMKGTTIIGKGQEIHQAKPFLMKKSTTINANTKARLVKA